MASLNSRFPSAATPPAKTGGSLIYLPTMGAGHMPDTSDLIAKLREKGVEVVNGDIDPNDLKKFQQLPWERIDVIDLSHMRSCLTSFDKYMGIVNLLLLKQEEEAKRGHVIEIFPKKDVIDFLAHKAEYLRYFHDRRVDIVNSLAIRKHSKKGRPSSEDPDQIDQAAAKVISFMEQKSDKEDFVLKPSVSSLGKGLIFLHFNRKENKFSVEFPHEGRDSNTRDFDDKNAFDQFLKHFFSAVASPDDAFIIQEYVQNTELSAVLVNGTTHYVLRTPGPSRIAHARYGGQDIIILESELPDELLDFIQNVERKLPGDVLTSPFLRIDIYVRPDGSYALGEIEGAGAVRLWLKESGRLDEYADMLISLAHKNRQLTLKNAKQEANKPFPADGENPRLAV